MDTYLNVYKPSQLHKSKRAFTLLEVIIASSISITMFAIVYNMFFSTLKQDKVSEEYNKNIFQSRVVLLRIQRELRDARDLIHPTLATNQTIVSSKYIVFKDKLNKIKTIYLDTKSKEVKMFEIKLPDGEIVSGKKSLGKSIESLVFTYDIKSSSGLQFRVGTKGFQLLGAVRLLNV